jgi:hypothetical protein
MGDSEREYLGDSIDLTGDLDSDEKSVVPLDVACSPL